MRCRVRDAQGNHADAALVRPGVPVPGFRPFFLGAAAWAVLSMAAWLPMLAGRWGDCRFGGPALGGVAVVDLVFPLAVALVGLGWIAAFDGFVVAHGAFLLRPRPAKGD